MLYLEHDALIRLRPGTVLLAADDLMQGLESSMLLSNILQFISTLQRILRSGETGWAASERAGHGCKISLPNRFVGRCMFV